MKEAPDRGLPKDHEDLTDEAQKVLPPVEMRVPGRVYDSEGGRRWRSPKQLSRHLGQPPAFRGDPKEEFDVLASPVGGETPEQAHKSWSQLTVRDTPFEEAWTRDRQALDGALRTAGLKEEVGYGRPFDELERMEGLGLITLTDNARQLSNWYRASNQAFADYLKNPEEHQEEARHFSYDRKGRPLVHYGPEAAISETTEIETRDAREAIESLEEEFPALSDKHLKSVAKKAIKESPEGR